MTALTLIELCGFAFAAGGLDAIVGGGGLIQLPALFMLMRSDIAPAVVLGTNKFAAVWGTLAAAVQYSRRVPMETGVWLAAGISAAAASFVGARTVSIADPRLVRPLVLCALLAALAYTLWKPELGALHAPRLRRRAQTVAAVGIGGGLGFYDGFIGPGTGSFLIFAFIGVLGFSFLSASAAAKRINVLTNLAALAWFIPRGEVLFPVAMPMALCNVAGSLFGARLAIRQGSGFVRGLFIVVVAVLVARFAYALIRES